MVKVLCRYPGSILIRASWRCVQRALWDSEAAKARCKKVSTTESNLLFTGAKAKSKSPNGLWMIHGYSANLSDVDKAIERMQVPACALNA